MLKYLLFLTFFLCFLQSQAQYTYKQERSTFSLIGRVGLPDQVTRGQFGAYYSIGLRKEFSLGKFFSINAVADNNLTPGKGLNANLNTVALGGGVTVYPFYLINLIFGRTYDETVASKDGFYFDEQFETNLNSSNYGSTAKLLIVKFEANFVKIHLNKNLILSPKVGIATNSQVSLPTINNNSFSFTYIGVGLELGKNKK